MNRRRVVITGMGLVSCFGSDVDLFYRALCEGKSGVVPIAKFDASDYPTRIAAEVRDFDAEGYLDRKQARRVDPCIAYACVAGKRALEAAALSEEARGALDKERCGILIGSGMGGMYTFSENLKALESHGVKRVSPFMIPYIITNMGGGLLAIDLGFRGPNYSVSTACSTASYAMINAANHIRRGDADLMVCGGVEAAVLPIGVAGFCAIRALSQRNEEPVRASRPWDKSRDGFVIGEGGAALVFESLEHARRRGAPILAEYLGGGLSCDAYHMTDLCAEGVALAMRCALKDAAVEAGRVNYVSAHATSTLAGDMVELEALRRLLPDPKRVALGAIKSMIGHTLGAAGAMAAIAAVKSINEGVIPPTINLEEPEEEIAFTIPRSSTEYPIEVALCNSFGFGGHNAVLALAPFRE